MKNIFAVLLAVVIVAAFLAGCQATPEKPVVIQKDMEQMIEKGMEQMIEKGMEKSDAIPTEGDTKDYSALCEHYGVPERFQAHINEEKMEINCDVEIELPKTTKLPMSRVEAGKFSQEQVYSLFNALCGDTQMYILPRALDKAHCQEAILKYQALLAKAADERVIKSLSTQIDLFKKEYETAPDTVEIIPSDGTLQIMNIKYEKTDASSGTQTYLQSTSDPYDIQIIYSADTLPNSTQFTVYNDIDYYNTSVYSYMDKDGNTQVIAPRSGSQLTYQREADLCRYGLNGTKLKDVTELSLSGGTTEECMLTVTPKQARMTVEQFMAKTGIDDMAIDSVFLYTSGEDNRMSSDKIKYMEQMGAPVPVQRPETQAYVFRLLRQLNGVKVESTQDSSETNIDNVSYGKEWMYEALTIAVDDKGIANLFWTGPLEVTEILTDNTKILPWSDIENVFEKMIVIQNTDYADFYSHVTLNITHASLSLQRIMEQDSFTSGLLVPVWNFYGTRTCVDEQEDRTVVFDEDYLPLISINAINGSVIDPQQGY